MRRHPARRPALTALLSTALLAMPLVARPAQQSATAIRPVLEAGVPVVIDGEIGGFDEVTYVVQLRAGQSLRLSLASNNNSNCFDIYAPGVPKPVYVGGDSGSTHRLVASTAGDYVVKVFLLRLAARDDQTARFMLELRLD